MENNKETYADLADKYKSQCITLIAEHNITKVPNDSIIDPDAFLTLRKLAEQYKSKNDIK